MKKDSTIEMFKTEMSDLYKKKDWLKLKEKNIQLANYEILKHVDTYEHMPEAIQLELTSRCNAQCVMCSHYYEFNDKSREVEKDVINQLKKFLPYCRVMLLNGYGEPFIANQFVDCLHLLKEYKTKAIVTTNLSYLTNEMLELIPSVFLEINVSCTGYNSETYERIHKGLCFNTLDTNLERLLNVCDNHTQISLSCVAMVETVSWASSIVQFAHDRGISKVRFGRLGVSKFIKNYEQDLCKYPNYAAMHFKMAKNLADELGIKLVFPSYFDVDYVEDKLFQEQEVITNMIFKYDVSYQQQLRKEFLTYFNSNRYKDNNKRIDTTLIRCTGICDWVGKGIYISSDGNMYSCCESKFANYNREWNGEVGRQLRNEFYNGTLPVFCKNCPFIANNELQMLHCEWKRNLNISSEYIITKG